MVRRIIEKNIWLVVCSVAVCIFATYFLGQGDMYVITSWAKQLLIAINQGKFLEYPQILQDMSLATNYSMVMNIFFAICLLPIYLVDKLNGYYFSEKIYYGAEKTVIFVLVIITVIVLYQLCMQLHYDAESSFILTLMFVISPITILSNLGRGQVDVISLLFMLLACKCYLKEHYVQMAWMVAISILIKPFGLIFWGFFLVLQLFKFKWKAILYFFISISLYCVDHIVTVWIFPKYYIYAKTIDEIYNQDYAKSLFEAEIGDVSLFVGAVVLLLLWALYLSYNHQVKEYHFLLLPVLTFGLFFLLVYWHLNWVIYVFPFVLLMCGFLNDWNMGLFLTLILNMGFTLFAMVYTVRTDLVTNIRLSPVLFSLRGVRNEGMEQTDIKYIGDYLNQILGPYCQSVGKTIFMCAFFMIIIVYILNIRHKSEQQNNSYSNTKIWQKILLWANMLPSLFIIIGNIVLYTLE